MKNRYKFKLFISGMSINSVSAVENLKKLCDKYLQNEFELEIIDISIDRKQAAENQIFAIPTLIKTEPSPMRTILGDLSDQEKVLKILDIS